MNTATRRLAAPFVVAVMVLAAACGGGSDSADDGTGADGDWAAQADRTAVLRLARSLVTPNISGTFDPLKSTSAGDIDLGRLIYGTLTHQGAEGPEPGLAESWDIPDPQTLVLKLRAGVTFSDGTPFDAAAVKAGLDRNRAEASPYLATLTPIESVEATDDTTVTITTTRPVATGLLLAFSGREGMIPAPASLAAPDTMASEPIGAGPFTLDEWKSGDKAVLTRNADYYDKDAYPVGGITFVHLADAASRRNAILAGDVDLANIDQEGVAPLEANPKTGVQVNDSDTGFYINLNTSLSNPPLDDVLVRQAMNHAFNREELAKTVYQGAEPKWQIFPPGYPGHDPELDGYYAYDVDKAKDLLAEAGYPDGFSMTLASPAPPYPSARASQVFKENMAAIGIKVKIVNSISVFQDYHIDKKTDAGQNLWLPRPDPSQVFLTLYSKGNLLNTSGYDNPELTDLVYETQGLTDPDEIAANLQQASRLIVEEAREIGVVYTPARWGFSSKLGFVDGKLRDFGNDQVGADLSTVYVKK